MNVITCLVLNLLNRNDDRGDSTSEVLGVDCNCLKLPVRHHMHRMGKLVGWIGFVVEPCVV